jgi:hypothetical protein
LYLLWQQGQKSGKAEGWVIRFRSIDGEWVVDVIRLSLTGDHRDGECFRVSRHGFFVAEVKAIDELRQHIDPAELEEALVHGGSAVHLLQVQ